MGCDIHMFAEFGEGRGAFTALSDGEFLLPPQYGLFAALYALREGGIWGISAQHAVWNWAQANLYGFEVSGIGANGGSLFNLMETGPDPLTGGAFGPEGGLAVTLVLLLAIALLVLQPRLTRGRALERPSSTG